MKRRWRGGCDAPLSPSSRAQRSGAEGPPLRLLPHEQVPPLRRAARGSGRDDGGGMTTFPTQARVVVIGGGIMGCSTAYHLAKLGWKDVVLLERRQLTCGTTWHAAGLVGQLRATYNMTRLAQYSAELFRGLEAETGSATGFRQTGSLAVASDDERFEELKRGVSMAHSFGLAGDVLTPEEAG